MRLMAGMVAVVLLVSACGRDKPETSNVKDAASARQGDRLFSAERLFRGVRLFQEHCAQCHGPEAQGHPDWQNPRVAAAPPLNGSGHAWHHPKTALQQTIRSGTLKLGGSMPAWKDKLTDDDIEAVIAWFQSTWPDEIYRAWSEIDRRARRGEVGH